MQQTPRSLQDPQKQQDQQNPNDRKRQDQSQQDQSGQGIAPGEQPRGAAPHGPGLWLGVWLLATTALAWQLATAWPYEGHWAQLLMLFTLAGAAFRALECWHQRGSGSRLAGPKRFVMRVLAIAAALVTVGLAGQALSALSMARFERSMAPVMAQIGRLHAAATSLCETQGQAKSPGRLAWDAKRFVFWTRGGSIDIDGSTIWYDSASDRWSKFHNDNRQARGDFETLLGSLRECTPSTP